MLNTISTVLIDDDDDDDDDDDEDDNEDDDDASNKDIIYASFILCTKKMDLPLGETAFNSLAVLLQQTSA